MTAQARRPPRGQCMPAHGSSMFPFVPAGSTLMLRARGRREIRVGDIVCYPNPRGELVAHRVVLAGDTHRGEATSERIWLTRGDALDATERVPERAIGWVVERVSLGSFGYRTGGAFGRAVARLALARGPWHRAARDAVRVAVYARRLARRLGPQ